ncbi:hypothetical protein BD413DRAFT_617709 [Trametes elegans]|nr:hypothetical protein BD413DRAFT_617709 [Trametes elegans]
MPPPDIVTAHAASGTVQRTLLESLQHNLGVVHLASSLIYEDGIVPLLSLTTFCAADTVLTAFALVLLTRKQKRRHRPARLLSLAVVTLYITSCIDWGDRVRAIVITSRSITSQLQTAAMRLDCILPPGSAMMPEACATPIRPTSLTAWPTSPACLPITTLNINVILGDTIVWWRAHYRIRLRRRRLLVHAPHPPGPPSTFGHRLPILFLDGVLSGPLYRCTIFGALSLALSLFTNAVATALIAAKAWQHRRFLRAHLGHRSRRTQVERALALLVESGAGYCVLIALSIAFGFVDVPVAHPTPADDTRTAGAVASGLAIFLNGSIVPLIGIYPTLLVLLVARNNTRRETLFTYRGASPSADSDPPARGISLRRLSTGGASAFDIVFAAPSSDAGSSATATHQFSGGRGDSDRYGGPREALCAPTRVRRRMSV